MVKKVSEISKEVSDNLYMVHNPFAETTNQPKIPDGKTNDSLGFSTTSVFELSNGLNTEGDTLHLILYAGQNCALLSGGDKDEPNGSISTAHAFVGSGDIDWSDVTSAQGGVVDDTDRYALWRVVSCGLQLKLLNPVEEDEGWFEAIRINEPMDAASWRLMGKNGDITATAKNNGTIGPVGLLQYYSLQESLCNDATYSTGLLRDLHRMQFELHGRTSYHDFIHKRSKCRLDEEAVLAVSGQNEALLQPGHDDAHELVDNFVDPSYDMIYLRLHCRDVGSPSIRGSQFHTHVVSNQEIYFPVESREARFHTKNVSIGANQMSIHFQGRRNMANAATLIG